MMSSQISNVTYKGIEISCDVGRIETIPVDAIAVSCDSNFTLNVGIGKAIRNAGGPLFLKNVAAAKSNMISSTILDVHGSGTIAASRVFLVVIRNTDKNSLDSVYARIFSKATYLNLSSLAIPLLGTGAFGSSIYDATDSIVMALENSNIQSLKNIRFIDVNDNAMKHLGSAILALSKKNGSKANGTSNAQSQLTSSKTSKAHKSGVVEKSKTNTPSSHSSATTSSGVIILGSSSDTGEEDESNGTSEANDSSEDDDYNGFMDDMFDDLYEGSKSSDSNDDEDSDSTDDSVSSDSNNDAPVADAPTSSNKNMKMTTSKPKKEALHWTIISPEKLEHKNCKNAKSTGKVPKKKKRDNIDEEKPICSICLSDLILENDSQAQGQEAEIAKLKHCSHLFHQECIEQAFKVKEQCPLCMTWYSASTGNQPENATMTVSLIAGKVPGHSDANGCHFITYTVPSGIQTDQHLRPGVPYSSTVRYAYIPNNREGSLVLKMLKLAFERRLTFTIGDSVTSGMKNVPVWNGIHHKTRMDGGPQSYGYPDDTYFERVKSELAAVGITKSMVE